MKGLVSVKVAGLFLAALLIAGCYAPIANPNGYLSLNLQFAGGKAVTNEVIGLVVNADYENEFKEMLYLIDQGDEVGLSTSEADRLIELASQLATNGLVKFGGFPFFQTTIDPTPGGSFELSGIPAGRSYFIKLYEFPTGFSFSVDDIDEDFGNLILAENRAFSSNEDYTGVTDEWKTWTPNAAAGQPAEVKAGEVTTISATLTARTP